MHICISNVTTIGSDNGLSLGRRQAIIWANTGILLNASSGTNFHEVLIEIHTFSFKKIYFKMSSGEWRPSCLGLNASSQHTDFLMFYYLKKQLFLKIIWGLIMPYGITNLGQHRFRWWLVARWHQGITWTDVNSSSIASSGIHLRAISWEILKLPMNKMCLKIINLTLL